MIIYLVKWDKTDGINVSLELGCDASTIYMPRQLGRDVVRMLDLLGVQEDWKKKITII